MGLDIVRNSANVLKSVPKTKIVIYQNDNGDVPVLEWLRNLPTKARAKCTDKMERLTHPPQSTHMKTKKPTTDALEIIHREFFEGQPERIAELEQARSDGLVARKIYHLRTQAGLSQRALAKMVGTTASVICRLEDADYDGHSMAMLNRIAAALDRRVEIRFVPLKKDSNNHVFA